MKWLVERPAWPVGFRKIAHSLSECVFVYILTTFGMTDLPTDVKHTIDNFRAQLGELETLLHPFLSDNEDNLLSRLNTHDTAKLNLTLAYAMSTLFASTLMMTNS